MVVGGLSRHASVRITPSANQNIITCPNPLGVVPKLVRVRSTDRTTRSGCIYEYVLLPDFCAEVHRYQNNDRAREGTPTTSNPNASSYRQYRMTADAIEIVRSAVSAVWESGVTYTFHIYA